MRFACSSGPLRLLALLSLLLFAGDLLADSVAEICEMRCAAESSQSTPCDENAPCQCICATHVGAVIATDFAIRLGGDLVPATFLQGADEAIPPRLAASIDHPPQLA
jgi:hypothetical protein